MRSNVEGNILKELRLMGGIRHGMLSQTLGGSFTMHKDMPQVMFLDPDGSSRTVLLPAEALSAGLFFEIVNTGDGNDTLDVKEDSGTTTIAAVADGQVGRFFCDGTTWYGLLASDVTLTDITVAGSLTRADRKLIVPVSGNAMVGATSGWVITGVDAPSARLPAEETASTLVVPLLGLHVGDTVTAVAALGQVESGGNDVTCTMGIRKSTAVAADLTDAEIGTDNVGTLTEDTLLDDATGALKVSGLTEVMAATEMLYALITGTTAASTDIAIQALVVTYDAG